MSNKRLPLLILLLALVLFRFYELDLRPPHHDEAVNGWFVDGIFSNGFYRYDPSNYHGPLYFYLLSLFKMIFGRSLFVLRMVTVITGGLLTFSPFLFRKWIGERASWISAFALAVSPAVVFFSRYAIHEVPFTLMTIVFFYFWLRAREEYFSWKILVGLGLSLGAIASLKENFIIFLGCLLIAEIMIRIYGKEKTFPKNYSFYSGALPVALLVIVLIYSAFGKDENGVMNFFAAFNFWSETGSKGNGHEKPFIYWFNLFMGLEWAALLGLLLSPLALSKVPQSVRLISVVSVGVYLAYSIVHYKTPWCVVCFQWGFVIVFGYWISRLWEKMLPLAWVAITLIVLHGGFNAYRISYVEYDADDSYYIYGQTYRTFMPAIQKIMDQVKQNPELKQKMRIQIISTYTWPLPYLLGELKMVGYYGESNAPATLDADYLFLDEQLEAKYKDRISGNYDREVVRARQWASPMVIYTRKAN